MKNTVNCGTVVLAQVDETEGIVLNKRCILRRNGNGIKEIVLIGSKVAIRVKVVIKILVDDTRRLPLESCWEDGVMNNGSCLKIVVELTGFDGIIGKPVCNGEVNASFNTLDDAKGGN